MPIIKIASSDMNDWVLIEKIASTRRPTIVSTGGASEKDLDDLVHFFEKRDIPLAMNHCVSPLSVRRQRTRTRPDRLPQGALSEPCDRPVDARVPRLAFIDADFLRQGRAHLGAPYRHRLRRRCGVFRIVHCPSSATPGSRRFTRRPRCAAGAATRSGSSPGRRSSIWMPWCAAPMPGRIWNRAMSSARKASRRTSIWRSRCARGNCPAAR